MIAQSSFPSLAALVKHARAGSSFLFSSSTPHPIHATATGGREHVRIYSFFPSLQQTGTSPSRRIIYFYCSAVGNKRQSIPPVYRPRGHTSERKRNRRGLPSTQKSIAAQGYVYTRIFVPPPAWRIGNEVVLSTSSRLMTECRKCQEVPKWERI